MRSGSRSPAPARSPSSIAQRRPRRPDDQRRQRSRRHSRSTAGTSGSRTSRTGRCRGSTLASGVGRRDRRLGGAPERSRLRRGRSGRRSRTAASHASTRAPGGLLATFAVGGEPSGRRCGRNERMGVDAAAGREPSRRHAPRLGTDARLVPLRRPGRSRRRRPPSRSTSSMTGSSPTAASEGRPARAAGAGPCAGASAPDRRRSHLRLPPPPRRPLLERTPRPAERRPRVLRPSLPASTRPCSSPFYSPTAAAAPGAARATSPGTSSPTTAPARSRSTSRHPTPTSSTSSRSRSPTSSRRTAREDGAAAAAGHGPVPRRRLPPRQASRSRAQPPLPRLRRRGGTRRIPGPDRRDARTAQGETARGGRARDSATSRHLTAPLPPQTRDLELRYASQLHADPLGGIEYMFLNTRRAALRQPRRTPSSQPGRRPRPVGRAPRRPGRGNTDLPEPAARLPRLPPVLPVRIEPVAGRHGRAHPTSTRPTLSRPAPAHTATRARLGTCRPRRRRPLLRAVAPPPRLPGAEPHRRNTRNPAYYVPIGTPSTRAQIGWAGLDPRLHLRRRLHPAALQLQRLRPGRSQRDHQRITVLQRSRRGGDRHGRTGSSNRTRSPVTAAWALSTE